MEEEVLKRFGAMLENEYNKYLSASSKRKKKILCINFKN